MTDHSLQNYSSDKFEGIQERGDGFLIDAFDAWSNAVAKRTDKFGKITDTGCWESVPVSGDGTNTKVR